MSDVTETDYTTNPPTVTERDFTAAELAQRETDVANTTERDANNANEAALKAGALLSAKAKLSALGLDALEVQAIIGTV